MKSLLRIAALSLMLLPAMGSAQTWLETAVIRQHAEQLPETTRLAEQGDASAQYKLGNFYREGKVVPQDYAEASKWYRLAALQGHGDAQFHLGWMYEVGRGVPQDFMSAHMWYNISSANGVEVGRAGRSIVDSELAPADLIEAQRRASACMASSYRDCGAGLPSPDAKPHRWWWPW